MKRLPTKLSLIGVRATSSAPVSEITQPAAPTTSPAPASFAATRATL